MSANYRAFVEPRLDPAFVVRVASADGGPAFTRIDLKQLQASCPGA